MRGPRSLLIAVLAVIVLSGAPPALAAPCEALKLK